MQSVLEFEQREYLIPANLYKTDFYVWTVAQSKLLKGVNFKHSN